MTPDSNPKHSRKWLVLVAAVMLAGGYIAVMKASGGPRSATLPDGTKVIYHSASRGVPAAKSPEGYAMFDHFRSSDGNRLRDVWKWLRDRLPAGWRARLPEWTTTSWFHSGTFIHECELRFVVEGSLRGQPWRVFIADEGGWETEVTDIGWQVNEEAARAGGSKSGWLWLSSPVPRHSKTLKIRFRPSKRITPAPSAAQQREIAAELRIANPFHDGPAKEPAHRTPISKPVRGGGITLTKLQRPRIVGDGLGWLSMDFTLRNGDQPLIGIEVSMDGISDRSGQWFRQSLSGTSGNGRELHHATTDVAPWSDDLAWSLRVKLRHSNYNPETSEAEKFVFDHLPVPHDNRVEVNRTLTKNGITLRIGAIELSKYNDWRFCVEGWRPGHAGDHEIVIQDARDDQGRTHAKNQHGNVRIMGGPVGGSSLGPVYALHLPPDAKWWDLTLVPETAETVEFEVQPDFID